MTQTVHHCARKTKHIPDLDARRARIDVMVEFAEQLVNDIKNGLLAPHPQAHIHLISMFKECGRRDTGIRFWQWLEAQDDQFVDVGVYGAAIELLAMDNTPLADLEALYQAALSRFPGFFAAYHLSPEAILPDREKATTLRNLPMLLVQAILTARLLRGDSRNAYLALDTALRLYPDQVLHRFFTVFTEERPLAEAYTVFAIASRSGTAMSPTNLRLLLGRLRSNSPLNSVLRHSVAVRAMLSATYLFLGSGGRSFPSNSLTELVVAMSYFLRLEGFEQLDTEQKQTVANEVVHIIRSTISVAARYEAKPAASAFNTIIATVGGLGQSRRVIELALSEMSALAIGPDIVTYRSIVTAAGRLRDQKLLVESWQAVVSFRRENSQQLDFTDFTVLINATRLDGKQYYARQEFDALKAALSETTIEKVSRLLESESKSPSDDYDPKSIDPSSLLAELAKIRQDIHFIDQKTKGQPQVQDFRDQVLPMTLLPTQQLLSEAEMRKLYDELSTEQHPSQAPRPAIESEPETSVTGDGLHAATDSPAVSSTNIPFSTLRYENWKTINYLLKQSHDEDERYEKSVDEAFSSGIVPPARMAGFDLPDIENLTSYGLSDVEPQAQVRTEEDVSQSVEDIAKGREEILRLRGRIP